MLERGIADIEKNVSALEAKTEAQEKRIDSLEKSRENESRLLAELSTMVKQQAESSQEYKAFNRESMKTFERVNQNLSDLTASQEMQKHIQEVANKEMIKTFKGLRLDMQNTNIRMDNLEAENEKSKINFAELVKEVVFKVAPAVVLSWLLLKFGLN